MAKKSDKFGDMLTEGIHTIKRCEKKNISIIQDELGYALGYKGGSAVERWRQGYLPPTVEKLEKLTGLIFERRCGALDRAWFEKFLLSADHLYPESILEELFPARHSKIFLAPPLPEQALIGRDQLLLNLRQRLCTGDTQSVALFALNGLPGVGKTDLAIRLAHDKEVWERFPDGILWAGLGREPNVMALLSIWGVALEIPMSEMAKLKTPFERAWLIRAAIGERKMLLVIDDAWQIEEALAFKFGGPNCAHLLTTRQPKLALDFAGRGARPVPELNESDSLALLGEFVPDVLSRQPDEARALVQAVGGLPLALILIGRYIEKAVQLGQNVLLSRLLTQLQQAATRFELTLQQGILHKTPNLPYDVPLSLLASIEISDKALDKPARQMLRVLSVFPPKPNSFSEEAALNVADKPAETLKMLTDSGLLESGGTARYTMHQTIADYAAFTPNPRGGAYQRGASYFAAFAQQHRHSDGYRLLDADWQNVSHFLQWAYDNRHWQPVTNGTQALTHINLGIVGFMDARGHWTKVTELLQQALEGARALNDRQLEGAILTKLGAFAFRQSNFDAARHYLEQSLPYLSVLQPSTETTLLRTHLYEFMSRLEMEHDLEAARDWIEQGLAELETLSIQSEVITHQTGYFHILLSTLHGRMGNYAKTIAAAEKGLALLPLEPTAAGISALTALGAAFDLLGQTEKSIEYTKLGIEMAQALGDWRRQADLWRNMGINERQRGNLDLAIDNYHQALQLYQQIGSLEGKGYIQDSLGVLHIILGEDELALTYLTAAIGLAQENGLLRLEAIAQTNLAHLQIYRGHLDEAALPSEASSALSRADEICRQLRLTFLSPVVLYWQAEIARLNNRYEQAMDLIAKSLQIAKDGKHLLAEGIAWSIQGKILDGMQKFDEAHEAHQTSLQLLADQEPYDLAYSQLALAEHYIMRDGGVSERANALLIEALAIFERLGAKREIALIEGMRPHSRHPR